MKTTAEMIEVMQAYDRGEQIEESIDGIVWFACEPIWNWGKCDYRVKKKVYVPFETAEEFLAAQRIHGMTIIGRNESTKLLCFVCCNNKVIITDMLYNNKGDTTFVWLLDFYKFADGTPCGKEVET